MLVTSDKDYISLINKLRELRRDVVLVGNDQTSKAMQESATHFIPLSQILPAKQSNTGPDPQSSAQKTTPSLSFAEGTQCLLAALSTSTSKNRSHVSLSQLDKMMRNETAWSYKGYASVTQHQNRHRFSKFSQFIQAVEATGAIKISQENGTAYVSLPHTNWSGLAFEDAMQCVLHALVLHQACQDEPDVNITYVPGLVRKHLGFGDFTPTKIAIYRQNRAGRYSTLSKFLDDVANTGAIAIRRDSGVVYARLVEAPLDTSPPQSLLNVLAELQPEGLTQPQEPTHSQSSLPIEDIHPQTDHPEQGTTTVPEAVSATPESMDMMAMDEPDNPNPQLMVA